MSSQFKVGDEVQLVGPFWAAVRIQTGYAKFIKQDLRGQIHSVKHVSSQDDRARAAELGSQCREYELSNGQWCDSEHLNLASCRDCGAPTTSTGACSVPCGQ